MLFYSLPEILLIAAAAIVMDWIIGDPKWPTAPGHMDRTLHRNAREALTA